MFLQQQNASSADAKVKGFGGFMSASTDLNNICKKNEETSCVSDNANQTSFRGSWSWTSGGSDAKKLSEWCSNLDNCFSKMYEPQSVNLTTILESFTGSWKEEQITSSPST